MATSRRGPEPARAEAVDALERGRRRVEQRRPDGSGREADRAAGSREASSDPGRQALLALQRSAGNSAVSALLLARMRSPGDEELRRIDAATRELRGDDPSLDVVEAGLKEAKALGVPVELEGPKPPPQALAVTRNGFGPEKVPQKKPTPQPKPTSAVHPLGKAGGMGAKGGRGAGSVAGKGTGATKKAPGGGGGGGPGNAGGPMTTGAMSGGSLAADQLLQPPVPPTHLTPSEDPAFTAVTGRVAGFAGMKKAHPPAAAKAKEAQDAALAPSDDVEGQAKAAKVDAMDAQPVGGFDKKAFITAVKAAIEAKSPKTLKEADDYAESGKAGEVAGDVKGLVGQGKRDQAKDVETATAAPPDTSKGVAKPVTPMDAEEQDPAVAVPAAGAAPKLAPPEQVNLAGGKHEADSAMAEGGVTEEQLARSNEPEFEQAVTDKREAAAHADTAPAQYRAQEEQVLGQTKADAQAQTAEGIAGMQGSKAAALAGLVAQKGTAKSKDEARRVEVTTKIQAIFTATETAVKAILDGIDPKVDTEFTAGEAAARQVFESYVAAKMSAYKKDRYGGWLGGLRWAKDELLGMPSKVDEFYAAGRELYLKKMDGVITRVATIVGDDLNAAKKRIAAGRSEISTYVKSLPKDLQEVGSQASEEIGERFAQLESDVDAKQDALVDSLAAKYVEARSGLDARIEELQAENRGLVDKAIGAIKAVVNTIRGLVTMLTGVLAKAAGVVGDIVKDPIAFLGNLVDGVKGGILRFKDNILSHLKKGLMGWLFGALAEGGVELPETFDIKGIIKMLASIFGLTWANIRNRLVRQLGERAMGGSGEGRRHLHQAGRRRGGCAVGDVAGEARQHQGHDPGEGPGLRRHPDHHRGHHLADRAAEPGGGVHQGLQDDLRRHHVLRQQRLADHGVRQRRAGLGGRHGARQRVRCRCQDRGRAGQDGADPDRLPGQSHRTGWHRSEGAGDRHGATQAGDQGAGLRHQAGPAVGGPGDPGAAGAGASGQGGAGVGSSVGEGEGGEGQGLATGGSRPLADRATVHGRRAQPQGLAQ